MKKKDFVHLPGFPGYQINRSGVVLSKNGKPLAERRVGGGPGKIPYLIVALYDGHGGRTERYVHHLVLETFVGPRPDGMETRHLNGNHSDNRVENLAWGTKSENGADKVAHRPNCKKCDRPLEGRNLMMVSNGKTKVRRCRACHNEGTLARHNAARRKEVAGR